MANDPGKPILSNDPNRPRITRERGPGGWLWVGIIIVVLIVFWWAVSGASHHRNALANPASGAQPNQQNATPVTDTAQLTSQNAASLVGRPVHLARATVDEAANGGAFFIDANGTPLLVVEANAANTPSAQNGGAANQNAGGQTQANGAGQFADRGQGVPAGAGNSPPLSREHSALRHGDVLTIQGTIRKMPSGHEAMLDFNLTTGAADRASQSPIFIEATRVETAAK